MLLLEMCRYSSLWFNHFLMIMHKTALYGTHTFYLYFWGKKILLVKSIRLTLQITLSLYIEDSRMLNMIFLLIRRFSSQKSRYKNKSNSPREEKQLTRTFNLKKSFIQWILTANCFKWSTWETTRHFSSEFPYSPWNFLWVLKHSWLWKVLT